MENDGLGRAISLLKAEFGDDWKSIVQMLGTEDLRKRCGKDLTSFMAFPERGVGGSNRWPGNVSPRVVQSLLNYVLECKRYTRKPTDTLILLDPMSGSGSSKAAGDALGVRTLLYDLNPAPPSGRGNWNALKDEVDDSADVIFLHPPYHSMLTYSGKVWGKEHPDDLSRCSSYPEFIDKLNFVIKKLFMALRKDGRLAVLVGDVRESGQTYSIQRDMMSIGDLEAFIVKSQFNCTSDTRRYSKPFIPCVTEYMVVFHKTGTLIVPFKLVQSSRINLAERDTASLTWNHLIRMVIEEQGGKGKLCDIAEKLSTHPKAQRNPHFRDRIRATIYENAQQYVSHGDGWYSLAYQAV